MPLFQLENHYAKYYRNGQRCHLSQHTTLKASSVSDMCIVQQIPMMYVICFLLMAYRFIQIADLEKWHRCI